jgi:DNA modification methylase
VLRAGLLGNVAQRRAADTSGSRRPPRRGHPDPWRTRIVGHGEESPDGLLPNPQNWRRHPRDQQHALSGALDEIGWVQQVIVNRTTGHLVDGHLRVELALARGEPLVPVVYVDLSVDEERVVLASLDPIGAMAQADAATLAALLGEVTPSDEALRAMLEELGQQHDIHRAGMSDRDTGPLVPGPSDVYVKRGELWILGEHRLLVGDCTDPAQVARLFDSASATLLVTDPPDPVGGRARTHSQDRHRHSPDADAPQNDDWDEAVAFYRAFLVAVLPHLGPHAAIYQWHAPRQAAFVEAAWRACGLLVHQQLICVKARGVPGHGHYVAAHQPCFYGWVSGSPPLRRPPAGERTVWEIDRPPGAEALHDAQKPVELFARPIAFHTVPGDICFDPFLGSGTALIAAEQAGRRCFATEIDPSVAQMAIERWHAFTGGKAARRG